MSRDKDKYDESEDFDKLEHPQNFYPAQITLMDYKGTMKRRASPGIPRYHVFSTDKEPEKYYHQLLMLFYPWRMEVRDLKGHFDTYEDFYLTVTSSVDANKSRFEYHADILDQALEYFDNLAPTQHAWDLLYPETEQRREDHQKRTVWMMMKTKLKQLELLENLLLLHHQ